MRRVSEPLLDHMDAVAGQTSRTKRPRSLAGTRAARVLTEWPGEKVFFHHSSMQPGEFDALHEGEELDFTIEQDARGRGTRAANVQHNRSASNT